MDGSGLFPVPGSPPGYTAPARPPTERTGPPHTRQGAQPRTVRSPTGDRTGRSPGAVLGHNRRDRGYPVCVGHGHSHTPDAELSKVTSRTAKAGLLVFLALTAVVSVLGMIRLWPDRDALAQLRAGAATNGPQITYHPARILRLGECAALPSGRPPEFQCIKADVLLLGGPEQDTEAGFEIQGPGAVSGLRPADSIVAMRVDNAGNVTYAFGGIQRTGTTLVMALLFVVSVLAVARWRGFWALIGLLISVAVVAMFVLPALALGESGIAVGMIGSITIIFVVLYVAHGVSFRTSAALAGTILGLGISTALGALAVWMGRLSGYVDEIEASLANRLPNLNLRELMIAAMIISGLGVLNDVTITQTSAVWELRAAAPQLTRREVFQAGMRIGRDHIASTIYTIVFAYTGAALSVLLLLVLYYDRPIADLLTSENFGGEVLRTLASATGLVLSVPITTGLAALTIKPAAAAPNAPDDPRNAEAETHRPPARAALPD